VSAGIVALIQIALLFALPPLVANHLRHKRWEWAALAITAWVLTIIGIALRPHA
jgi:hypothetical protein